MKMICCALMSVTLLTSQLVVAQAHPDQPPEYQAKQQLLDLENHWLAVEGDPEALESILSPDFLHVVPMGIITKSDQLTFLRKHPAAGPNAPRHFEDMHVRVYGSVGIVNGVVVEERSKGATRKSLFTDVFAYQDGKWRAVNAQELPVGDTAR